MKRLFLFFFILNLSANAQNLVPYNSKGLWGYADTSGKIKIVPFMKNKLSTFEFGKFAKFTNDKNKTGFIDTNGNVIIQPGNYDYIERVFYQQLLIMKLKPKAIYEEGQLMVFNANGKLLINREVDRVNVDWYVSNRIILEDKDTVLLYSVNLNNASVKLLKKYQLKNFDDFIYKEINGEYQCVGYKLLDSKNECNYFNYDLNGNLTSYKIVGKSKNTNNKDEFDGYLAPSSSIEFEISIGRSAEGRLLLILDKTNAKDISEYSDARVVENAKEFVFLKRNDLWAIADTSLKLLTDFEYESIQLCQYNFRLYYGGYYNTSHHASSFIVKKNSKYGIWCIDINYNFICQFDSLMPYNDFYIVKKDNNWFVVSNRGRVVTEPEYGDFNLNSKDSMNILSNNRDVVIAIRQKDSFKLKSNLMQINNLVCSDIKKIYHTLFLKNSTDKYGLVFYTDDKFVFIPIRYKSIAFSDEIKVQGRLYYFVETADGRSGYVDEYGKEFFD